MSTQEPPSYGNPPAGPPAGWYPDPNGLQVMRWWDGRQWGPQTQPMPAAGQEPQRPDPGAAGGMAPLPGPAADPSSLPSDQPQPPDALQLQKQGQQGLQPSYPSPVPPGRGPRKPWTDSRKMGVGVGIGAGVLVLILIIVGVSAGSSGSGSGAAGSPSSAAGSPSAAVGSPSAAAGSPSGAAGSPSAAASSPAATASAETAAERKAAAERAHAIHEARLAQENTLISTAQWDAVIQNPDNYQGDIYTISGTVAEYNLNSNSLATQESAALVATDGNGNDFVVEAPASVLGDAQPGDTFTAKVTVLGSEEAENTVYGGTTEVPDFDASTFTVTS
jgi:hypothetical protein